jgi:hypothetical protein
VPSRVVHRVAADGPGQGQGDDPAAHECGAGIATRFSCVKAGAEHYGVSWPIAHAAFVAHVDPSWRSRYRR